MHVRFSSFYQSMNLVLSCLALSFLFSFLSFTFFSFPWGGEMIEASSIVLPQKGRSVGGNSHFVSDLNSPSAGEEGKNRPSLYLRFCHKPLLFPLSHSFALPLTNLWTERDLQTFGLCFLPAYLSPPELIFFPDHCIGLGPVNREATQQFEQGTFRIKKSIHYNRRLE